MDDKLKTVLAYLIEQTVLSGEPVGSQYLVSQYDLDISPATVRNYFSVLEQEGFIAQPHTSSGRLPTEKGYQYYVDNIMKPRLLSKKEFKDLEQTLSVHDEETARIKALAKSAAEIAQNAVIVSMGERYSYYTGLSHLFSQPEFKDWNRIVTMSDVLDRMDEVLYSLQTSHFAAPTILIGGQCPFGPMCGAVMASLPGGYTLGILGPMRMDYSLSVSLLKKITELLENNYVDQEK